MLDNNDIKKLIEAQEPVFATKNDLQKIKEDITEFKSQILTGQDEILGKLDILLSEKPVKDAQDKRKTEVLRMHNNALKRGKILLEGEIAEIDRLNAF